MGKQVPSAVALKNTVNLLRIRGVSLNKIRIMRDILTLGSSGAIWVGFLPMECYGPM